MIDKKEPAGGFWTFDSPREAYFDTPSHEMLNNAWQACNGEVKL